MMVTTTLLALLTSIVQPDPAAIALTAASPPSATASSPRSASAQPRIPTELLRHQFKRATPTRWCAHHRFICIHELQRRFHTFVARHPRHRTRWGTAANRRRWHHRYIRTWTKQFGDQGCKICSAAARPRVLAHDWSSFSHRISGGDGCLLIWEPWLRPQFPYDRSYRWDCAARVTSSRAYTSDDSFLLVCNAVALTVTGISAFGEVLTAGATTPGLLWGLAAESNGCAVGWGFAHFLNWP
jgi:hypothetical protein